MSLRPVAADPLAPWRPLIAAASARSGIPARWIERVMLAESGGRQLRRGRHVVSRAGALGLMQLMPNTWRMMRAAHALGRDPFDPADNILAGAFYLALLHRAFGYPALFAAYNAGPERYRRYLGGTPLPAETIAYVRRVQPEDVTLPRYDAPSDLIFAVVGSEPRMVVSPSHNPTLFYALGPR